MEIEEEFLRHIETERRLSEKTVDAYSGSLKMFKDFLVCLKDPRTLETADSDNIRDWMESMMERGRSSAYVNRSLTALKTFYRFCLSNGKLETDPAHSVTGPKKEKRLPSFLKEREIEDLLSRLEKNCSTYNNISTKTIIYTLYLTGLRASELLNLNDEMIDFVNKEIKVTGKRNKQRIIPFDEELNNILTEYIKARDEETERDDNAFFVTKDGKRITYYHIREITRNELMLVSSLKKRSPHTLRHTFATTMLNNEANLESIKKLLGHQSLNTTEIYTHTTFEQLKKTYIASHPRVKNCDENENGAKRR